MIPIPETQRCLLEQGNGNAALYFARMTPYDEGPGGKPKKETIATLGVAINKRLASNGDALNRIHSRQSEILKTTALQGGMVWELTAVLQSPFVSGLGSGHPTETGFILDRNTGLPCIPASAIKGVLRLACGLHIADSEPKAVKEKEDGQFEIPDTHPLFRRYFGDTDTGKKDSVRGQIAFLDAFPAALPQDGRLFKTDIMNPHFGKYYAGEQEPLETESPIPVKFLAVKEGTAFVFRCLALPLPERDPNAAAADVFRPFDGEDEQTLQALFEIAFTQLGFGGKTSVGYGRFDKPVAKTSEAFKEEEKHRVETERLRCEEMARKVAEEAARLAEAERKQREAEERKAEAEHKRQAEEERLAKMTPEEREIALLERSGTTDEAALKVYEKLHTMDTMLRGKAALALKKFWNKSGKWKGKKLKPQQKKRVDEIKAILSENQ